MARIPDLDPESFTFRQRQVYDEIAGPRGGVVAGPFAIWLRNLDLAERANKLGNVLRREGKLDRRLFELMVLVVARHWTAQYEWHAHEKHARTCGLAEDVIEAIRHRRQPAFAKDDERLIYEATTQLLEAKRIEQSTYDRLIALLGQDVVIEYVSACGFYTMVAMVLVAFEAPVPGGKNPLPA